MRCGHTDNKMEGWLTFLPGEKTQKKAGAAASVLFVANGFSETKELVI